MGQFRTIAQTTVDALSDGKKPLRLDRDLCSLQQGRRGRSKTFMSRAAKSLCEELPPKYGLVFALSSYLELMSSEEAPNSCLEDKLCQGFKRVSSNADTGEIGTF